MFWHHAEPVFFRFVERLTSGVICHQKLFKKLTICDAHNIG